MVSKNCLEKNLAAIMGKQIKVFNDLVDLSRLVEDTMSPSTYVRMVLKFLRRDANRLQGDIQDFLNEMR